MAMYTLSGILNLIHLRKSRNADYIIVLGAGIIGRQVPPLLAARIERGIEILRSNPHAMLIMSGGQGPGEDIPESEGADYYGKGVCVNRGKFAVLSEAGREKGCESRDHYDGLPCIPGFDTGKKTGNEMRRVRGENKVVFYAERLDP